MTTYDLSHLTQAPDQRVIGPIQDDEALLLFALIRTMRLTRALEIGGLDAYSARNFLEAIGPSGTLYTVDVQPVRQLADNHVILTKSCGDLNPADVGDEPLHLVFFDCHVFDAQMKAFACLRNAGIIDDRTVITLHDTGLHPHRWIGWAYEIEGGWVHQPVERQMVNELHRLGYDAICFHMEHALATPELPARHGLTIMRRFQELPTRPRPRPKAGSGSRTRLERTTTITG